MIVLSITFADKKAFNSCPILEFALKKLLRYFFGMRYFHVEDILFYYPVLKIAFEFFLIMAAFFLFYSLIKHLLYICRIFLISC